MYLKRDANLIIRICPRIDSSVWVEKERKKERKKRKFEIWNKDIN